MARTQTQPVALAVRADACCESVLAAPLDDAGATELAHAFAALGDPARLKLLGLIAGAENAEACVCNLVEPLGKSQPTVSHHLKVLADVGLIAGEKRGRWVWYSIVPGRLDQLRSALSTPAR